ncbi:MAG: L-threonylcarbamoyladenylate synthase, partial [Gemmatimonadales bacterium]
MTVVPFRTTAEQEAAVALVRDHLGRGGLLAYPTETVYGLGSRPLTADVERLAALKGRAVGKPFLLLVASNEMVESHGLWFTEAARAMADACWPGPLTLILSGGAKLPETLRGPEGGIAVRWTSHAGIAHLVASLGYPLTSTSANRPGGPTAPGVAAIASTFTAAVQDGTLMVLDGGVLG